MSCHLRVFGESLDIDALLKQVKLKPHRVWRKGELCFPNDPESEIYTLSGANFLASDFCPDEFDGQVDEATAFLKKHQKDVVKMVALPGVEDVILDFGIALRDVAIHSDYLPPAFLSLAGKLGIWVELSHF